MSDLWLNVAPLLVMLGLVLLATVHELWLTLGARAERVFVWAAGFSGVAAIFIVGRLLQRIAETDWLARLGTQVQVCCAFLFGFISYGALLAATDKPGRRGLRLAGLVALALIGVTVASPWVVSHEVDRRVDALGSAYLATRTGPLFAIVVAYSLAIAGACLLIVVRRPIVDRGRRRILRLLVVTMAIFGLHDLLVWAGALRSIQLFEYGFAAVAVGISYLVHRRVDALYAQKEAVAERFRKLAEATAEGVVVHRDGRILDVNDTMGELFGRSRESLIEQPIRTLFADGAQSVAGAVLFGAESGPIHTQGQRLDGSIFPVEVVGRVAGGDAGSGIIAIRDLTEQRKLHARLLLAERMSSLGTLAAGTAHEINNPLFYASANVQLAIERLSKDRAPEPAEQVELREMLAEAREGCDRIRQIVSQLGRLSRTDDDDEVSTIDVAEVVDSAIKMAKSEIRYRAELARDYRAVPPVGVDPGRLGQVVLNLLVNAAQAIEEGRADDNQIRVALRHDEAAGRVVIEISDTGRGIHPGEVGRIFDPFYTHKPTGVGTGLGLAISHQIVSDAGGEISVQSEVGEGSTFSVSIPEAEPAVAEEPRELRFPAGTPRRGRVLIVDDEPAVVQMLAMALAAHEVVTATTIEEAIAACGRIQFGVILCDVMMPDGGGKRLIEHLKERGCPMLSRVVLMSGGAFTPDATDFLRSVPNRTLKKPVELAALRGLIDKLLAESCSTIKR